MVSAEPAPIATTTRRRRWRLSLRRGLVVLVAFSLLVLATAGVVLLVSLSNLTAARQRIVRHIDPAEVAARDLRAALTDQETGVRGYVITGKTDFLDPYSQGLNEEKDALGRLEASTSSGVHG